MNKSTHQETRTIIDIGNSAEWLEGQRSWPQWMNTAWLSEKNTHLICELSNPDDLSQLRSLIPAHHRLIALPDSPHLRRCLSDSDLNKVRRATALSMGATAFGSLPVSCNHSDSLVLQNLQAAPPANDLGTKPTLALVSPMPPTPSGIANYCVEILPALSANYDVTLVVEEPKVIDNQLAMQYEVMGHTEFLSSGTSFDRAMYHFGNSRFHYDYFTMLKVVPGIVVLHDVYLGDCLFSNFEAMGTTELRQKIYASHGWAALLDCEGPVRTSIALYPACGSVFEDSPGVIVHNRFAHDILSMFFSASVLSNLSETVLARSIRALPAKEQARATLGLAVTDNVYASFGLINHNKCIDVLLDAWESSGLAENPEAVLYLVGGCGDKALARKIQTRIGNMPESARVHVTGFVDNTTYDNFLGAADTAIQLRKNSRGESSAAVLDSMAAGLATIVNAHGSMAEFSDDVVCKLPDDFSTEELAQALSSPPSHTIGERAQDYVKTMHSPDLVATQYAKHMEERYDSSNLNQIQEIYRNLLTPIHSDVSANTLFEASSEFQNLVTWEARGKQPPAGSQLLVDISAVVQHDLKSGIQRVVRNILRELLLQRDPEKRVEAIYYDFETEQFRYARTFVANFLGVSPLLLSDDPVETQAGDAYLGLDLFYIIAGRTDSRKWFNFWRGRGVKIYNIVYDLMPVILPDCFPPDQIPLYNDWLCAITDVSDGLVCISKAVADDYQHWTQAKHYPKDQLPKLGFFHLGADMETKSTMTPPQASEQTLLQSLEGQKYLLMVGTIEPRKGHREVLEAVTQLWREGSDFHLVIVGSTGWVEEEFTLYLHQINATSDQLHWLNFVSDSMLQLLYQRAAGTLMASHGEGFGLPLIEAAFHGSPLLARNLPVFREVCGKHAWYFDATEAETLAKELGHWLELQERGAHPRSNGMSWNNWSESTEQLLHCIESQQWYITPSS